MKINLPQFLVEQGLAVSQAEARRLVNQGMIKHNGQMVIFEEGEKLELDIKSDDEIKVARRLVKIP